MYGGVPKSAQFLILYGKRRVGKTELFREFIQNKDSIYFLASKSDARDQLGTFVAIVGKALGDTFITKDSFRDWRTFFDYLIDRLSRQAKPLVLVIDEFPYLVDSDKAIPSYFGSYGIKYRHDVRTCPGT